jgi:hypothetical protein
MGSDGNSCGGWATVTRSANTTGRRLVLLAGTERTSAVYCVALLWSTQDETSGWLVISRSFVAPSLLSAHILRYARTTPAHSKEHLTNKE